MGGRANTTQYRARRGNWGKDLMIGSTKDKFFQTLVHIALAVSPDGFGPVMFARPAVFTRKPTIGITVAGGNRTRATLGKPPPALPYGYPNV